jgi:RND family efflux transporter MFP subunit
MLLLGALALPDGAVAVSCESSGQTPATPSPPKVRVSQPLVREVSDYVVFSGQVDAPVRVELRPRVGGMLDKVLCQPGQEVKKGDLLFVVDPRPYQAELDRAEAEVARARARRKRWQNDRTRVKELAKNHSVGEAEVNRVESELLEADASLKAAQAACDRARLNLQFTLVSAPIAGTILGPVLAAGNVAVADRTPLATLVSLDPMYVYFDVDQQTVLNINRLRRDGKLKGERDASLRVQVGLEDEENFPRPGQVPTLNFPFDPKTGRARWRAVIPNPDRLLLPGMSARVKVVTSASHKALLVTDPIPRELDQHVMSWNLYVVTDQNLVEGREVTPGLLYGGLRVMKAGLKAGEWVVIDRVKEGTKVIPERVPMPGESTR